MVSLNLPEIHQSDKTSQFYLSLFFIILNFEYGQKNYYSHLYMVTKTKAKKGEVFRSFAKEQSLQLMSH